METSYSVGKHSLHMKSDDGNEWHHYYERVVGRDFIGPKDYSLIIENCILSDEELALLKSKLLDLSSLNCSRSYSIEQAQKWYVDFILRTDRLPTIEDYQAFESIIQIY